MGTTTIAANRANKSCLNVARATSSGNALTSSVAASTLLEAWLFLLLLQQLLLFAKLLVTLLQYLDNYKLGFTF